MGTGEMGAGGFDGFVNEAVELCLIDELGGMLGHRNNEDRAE